MYRAIGAHQPFLVHTGILRPTRTPTSPRGEVIMVRHFRRTLSWNHAALVVDDVYINGTVSRSWDYSGIGPLTFYIE
jgi:hypothetical protein